ncbi:MAG TPA: adenosylmethionine decarboxylase [Syntrophobacter fumaroxidans]|nr:adenosylmethionine decarboxylase [Syntrophobacter fumaroxidans]
MQEVTAMGMGKPEFGFGVHLMMDGYGCDPVGLQDMSLIYSFLDEYPVQMDMTKIMPPYVFRYKGSVPEDWGVSGFVLIAESHISIHTFPEKQYLSLDMFSCKPFDTQKAVEKVKKYFRIQKFEMKVLDRGQEFPNTIHESAQVVRMDRMLMQRSR